jgi:galactose mutarotase-like enzyme
VTRPAVTRSTIEDFNSFSIRTGAMEVSIIPELGGKINSLRDSRTGREWLWRHPRLIYKRVPHGSSYTAQSDTGGWDECFPSVVECEYPSAPWQGAAIQDHGELWSQTAQFEINEQADQITLLNRWGGIVLPYTFTRNITITENSARLQVEYEVGNKSDQPINYVWCIHPLLAIEPGMELHLPSSARFNVGGSIPQNLVSREQNLQYPFAASGLNFPTWPEASAGRAIKIWSDPLLAGDGWASLDAREGKLQIRWDVALLPQVAVWMNFGAWAADGGTPYFNLGLEPCIGAQDSLNDAVNQYNLFATVPPHGLKQWWLEIELTA